MFCWQLLHGSIAVKKNLAHRNLLHNSDANCSLCGCYEESISHLFFFSCSVSWLVWTHWCNLWSVQWVPNNKARSFFIEW
ncbi:hypothetical protein PTKIN_Ptkin10aG0113400 [Pterospermum kingtungense]